MIDCLATLPDFDSCKGEKNIFCECVCSTFIIFSFFYYSTIFYWFYSKKGKNNKKKIFWKTFLINKNFSTNCTMISLDIIFVYFNEGIQIFNCWKNIYFFKMLLHEINSNYFYKWLFASNKIFVSNKLLPNVIVFK